MAAIELLGKDIDFEIEPELAPRADEITSAFTAMVERINASEDLTQDDRRIFRLADGVLFFDVEKWRGRTLSRSFMDQQERIFNWQVDEFLSPNHLPETRASYYFHDCVHLDQYDQAGHHEARNEKEEVRREVEACGRQMTASEALGCGQYFLDYLGTYEADPVRIAERVRSGIQLAALRRPCRKAGLPQAFEA